jgi:RNA polymerase sigma-70 factor (ECF subfamily)
MYQRHVGDVYRYALVVLRNEADAEDVTQTTFLNAYRAFKKGERPRQPQNWLIAIAHNVCRQRFRQAARRPNEVAYEEELAEAVEPDDSPSAEDIRRALSHLAFNQRAALVMRELEGRSYTEIAEILGLSVSAVETLIFRARRALREQLEGGFTCHEAELAVSKQLDGRLSRADRGALRAHLRECEECARFARSQRAQRTAIRSLAAIPLPSSLASFFGGGGAAVTGGAVFGTGVVLKVAGVAATAVVAAGVGYEGVTHAPWRSHHHRQQHVAAPAHAGRPVVAPVARRPAGPGAPVAGRGLSTEPRGVKPKPGHIPRRAVEPKAPPVVVPPQADVTPGLALGHAKTHGKSPIRPVGGGSPRLKQPSLPRAGTSNPHAAKGHGHAPKPPHPSLKPKLPPAPQAPTPPVHGGKK